MMTGRVLLKKKGSMSRKREKKKKCLCTGARKGPVAYNFFFFPNKSERSVLSLSVYRAVL